VSSSSWDEVLQMLYARLKELVERGLRNGAQITGKASPGSENVGTTSRWITLRLLEEVGPTAPDSKLSVALYSRNTTNDRLACEFPC